MTTLLVTYIAFICLVILLSLSLCPVSCFLSSSCQLQEAFSLNGMYKEGDILLGGLFETHYASIFPKSFFTSKPQQPICQG